MSYIGQPLVKFVLRALSMLFQSSHCCTYIVRGFAQVTESRDRQSESPVDLLRELLGGAHGLGDVCELQSA